MIDVRKNLSEHFTIEEASHSDYAIKHNIDNTIPSIYYQNAINIATYILEPVRERFGAFSPKSWYRGKSLNEAIGGSKNSQHCTASAVDFEIQDVPNLEIALWIRDNLIYDQLILEKHNPKDPSAGWIHCSWVKGVNRQQSLRFDGKGYLKGIEDS